MRAMVSNACSGWITGSCSRGALSAANARAASTFSSTTKPQAKSEPWRSPPKEMGAATISSPMWHGPRRRAGAGSLPKFRTAFSMLSLQRWKPTRSPKQAVHMRFEGGMRMPLPWSTTNPLASVNESSMPHQRRTVSRILRTIWSSSRRVESIGIGLPQLLLQRPTAQLGDLGDGPGTVDRNHRGQGSDQAGGLAPDEQELLAG